MVVVVVVVVEEEEEVVVVVAVVVVVVEEEEEEEEVVVVVVVEEEEEEEEEEERVKSITTRWSCISPRSSAGARAASPARIWAASARRPASLRCNASVGVTKASSSTRVPVVAKMRRV